MAILESETRRSIDGVRRRFSRDEYYKMGEVGILGESDELIDGVVMVKGSGKPWHWTTDDYDQMSVSEILKNDERVELLEGEVIALAPIGPAHLTTLARLTRVLIRLEAALGAEYCVLPEAPIKLSNDIKPQTDIAVVHGALEDFESREIAPSDLRLVVEISDSTLPTDRKRKHLLYAQAGIPEYWIVNLRTRQLEVYREPSGAGYGVSRLYNPDETVELHFAPGVAIAVSDFLPAR